MISVSTSCLYIHGCADLNSHADTYVLCNTAQSKQLIDVMIVLAVQYMHAVFHGRLLSYVTDTSKLIENLCFSVSASARIREIVRDILATVDYSGEQ